MKKEKFSVVSKNEFDRPYCPLMSYQRQYINGQACLGPSCIFCRGDDCPILIAKSLETYIKSKDPLAFISDEDLNEIEPMWLKIFWTVYFNYCFLIFIVYYLPKKYLIDFFKK